jgi:hypothetical protein
MHMNRSKIRALWLLLAITAFFSFTVMLLAADGAPASVAPNPLSLPLLIPFASPLLVAVIKGLAPKVPKVCLPIVTPIIGAGLAIVLQYSAGSTATGLDGAILGAAGVALREGLDQLKKLGGTTKPAETNLPE